MWCTLTFRPEKEANLCTSLRCGCADLSIFPCGDTSWIFPMLSRAAKMALRKSPQELFSNEKPRRWHWTSIWASTVEEIHLKRISSPPSAASSQDLSPRRICCWCHLDSPDAICGKSLNILKTLKSTQGKVGWDLRPPLEEIVKSGDDNATPLGGIFTDRWQSWTRLRQ